MTSILLQRFKDNLKKLTLTQMFDVYQRLFNIKTIEELNKDYPNERRCSYCEEKITDEYLVVDNLIFCGINENNCKRFFE